MSPSIGDMRSVVVFTLPTKATDTTGGRTEAYTSTITTRGKLTRKDGFRSFDTGYDKQVSVYDLFVYWRKDMEANLTKDVTVTYDGKNYSVVDYELVDERRSLYKIEIKGVK